MTTLSTSRPLTCDEDLTEYNIFEVRYLYKPSSQ